MIGESDKRRFFEQGYLLVEDVVPADLCEAVCDFLAGWLQIDPEDRSTWPRARGHGIVPVHHAQPLWDLRQHPAIFEVFRRLYDSDDLWVTFDRASFKPPAVEQGLLADPIHWDGDPTGLKQHSIQGLVYLRDTQEQQGAFCCVPDVYADLDAFLIEQPDAPATRRPADIDEARIECVGGPQGSMVLWHRRMPHSSTLNQTDLPRWVQYVAMELARGDDERNDRIDRFEAGRPPEWAVVQNVPGQVIPEPGGPPQLTDLGRHLVGYRWSIRRPSSSRSSGP